MRGVCAITPPGCGAGEKLVARCRQALEGGASMLQLRLKDCTREGSSQAARALRALTREFGVPLIINDLPDLALETEADGVHLGNNDTPVSEARRKAGRKLLIGASCGNSVARARQAVADGASYVSFGAFHPSATKPDAPVCSPGVLAQFRRELPGVPVFAIGGIVPANAPEAVAAGADVLAVCGGIFGAADAKIAAMQLSKAFHGQPAVG